MEADLNPVNQHAGVFSGAINEQSAEQKELSRKIDELFLKAKRAKKVKQSKWEENFEFYLGRQWPYRRPSYRHSEVVNLIFAAVESVVPVLLDNRPEISFQPEDAVDRDLAEALTKLADADWNRLGWSYVLADILKISLIQGTGIGSVEFDPMQNDGLGEIVFENIDIYNFFPAPRAKDINDGDCPYVIEAKPIPLEEARAMFPDLAAMINGGIESGIPSRYEKNDFDTSLNANAVRSNEASDDATTAYTSQESKKLNECLLIKCWWKDDSTEEVELAVQDALGNPLLTKEGVQQVQKETKKKYPNGRYVVKIDDLIAYDGENPYKDGKFPYARLVDYQIPNEFWAMGEVEQLKSPQRMVNRLLSFMMDTIVLMGNPIWVADMGAIDTDQVTNQPGLIVEKTPGTDVHREQGIGLPANILNVYQLCLDAFERIFGAGEITQGSAPTGITAGVALDSLQEAAQTRLRQKARNLEKFLNEIGTLYLSRVMQYYTTPRLITISNEIEGAHMKQFKFQIQKAPEDTAQNIEGEYIAKVTEMVPPGEGQVGMQEGTIKTFKTKGLFDVRSTIGSNLPFAKRAKAETAMKLFELGVLTPKRLLEDLDYPNAEVIAQELQANQQAAAQASAQQGKG